MKLLTKKNKNLRRNIAGVAAIEFAILLPFLLAVFYGVFEVSKFIMIARRADSVANDIAFILSREGRVALNTPINTPCPAPGCQGGKQQIDKIFDAVIPLIMYPYGDTDGLANGYSVDNYQIEARMVAFPVFNAAEPNTVDKNSLRVMWSNRKESFARVTGARAAVSMNSGGTDYNVTNDIANKTSKYDDVKYGTRADLRFPGQSVILVNFAFGYDSVLASTYPVTGGVLPNTFEKVASYAVRSQWRDAPSPGFPNGDGRIQSNEFINDMHYCTDCNQLNSIANSGMTFGSAKKSRQTCIDNNPVITAATGNYYAGGCYFN